MQGIQRRKGRGERRVKSKASMVALVAWPDGKLNLSTNLIVATLVLRIFFVRAYLNYENLIINIVGRPPAPGESFKNSNNDNVKDEANQEVD